MNQIPKELRHHLQTRVDKFLKVRRALEQKCQIDRFREDLAVNVGGLAVTSYRNLPKDHIHLEVVDMVLEKGVTMEALFSGIENDYSAFFDDLIHIYLEEVAQMDDVKNYNRNSGGIGKNIHLDKQDCYEDALSDQVLYITMKQTYTRTEVNEIRNPNYTKFKNFLEIKLTRGDLNSTISKTLEFHQILGIKKEKGHFQVNESKYVLTHINDQRFNFDDIKGDILSKYSTGTHVITFALSLNTQSPKKPGGRRTTRQYEPEDDDLEESVQSNEVDDPQTLKSKPKLEHPINLKDFSGAKKMAFFACHPDFMEQKSNLAQAFEKLAHVEFSTIDLSVSGESLQSHVHSIYESSANSDSVILIYYIGYGDPKDKMFPYVARMDGKETEFSLDDLCVPHKTSENVVMICIMDLSIPMEKSMDITLKIPSLEIDICPNQFYTFSSVSRDVSSIVTENQRFLHAILSSMDGGNILERVMKRAHLMMSRHHPNYKFSTKSTLLGEFQFGLLNPNDVQLRKQ
jgi:hypothetical protein